MADNTVRAYNGRLIFDHLPKTAGSAVNAWLQGELGGGCVSAILGGSHRELVKRYGGQYSIISGHLEFCGDGLDPRYQYMTLLREPVDRIVSHIFFILKNHDKSQLPELFSWAEGFFSSEGRHLHEGFLPHISNFFIRHFVSIENSITDGFSDDEKINKALDVIKRYDVVGLYEDIPRFLEDIAKLIGIPAPPAIERVNVTKSRPSVDRISPELRRRLIDLNQLDIRLYNEVVAWKKAQPPKERKKILGSLWQKYEPVSNRVMTTSDISEVVAMLREGFDILHGQMITFDVDFLLTRQVKELEAGIHIFDENRQWAFGTNSTLQNKKYTDLSPGAHRITHHLIADLPAGRYTAGFAFAERLSEGKVQKLAWYDVLCEFSVKHDAPLPFAGYAYLPVEMVLQLSDGSLIVQEPVGHIAPIGLIGPMKPGEERKIAVTVCNTGRQLWLGDHFRPVQLSYHWNDQDGTSVIYDGLRTGLPEGGIAPGGTVEIEMTVQAPASPEPYELVLTLVQERIGWFETKGFVPCKVQVEVAAAG